MMSLRYIHKATQINVREEKKGKSVTRNTKIKLKKENLRVVKGLDYIYNTI